MALELEQARREHNWTGRFVLIHADVGRMEWKQSLPHCEQMAARVGAEFVVVKHSERDLLEGIHRRQQVRPDAPPFPSSAARWCTSDFKRSVIDVWLRNNIDDAAVCTIGFRREESRARRKKPFWQYRTAASSKQKHRTVADWHPILEYTLTDVWRVIGYTLDELAAIQKQVKITGVVPDDFKAHPAYALGNHRVSCALCVLADQHDLLNGARYNPELFRELVDIEIDSGFSFQQNKPLSALAPELLTDEQRAALANSQVQAADEDVQLSLF